MSLPTIDVCVVGNQFSAEELKLLMNVLNHSKGWGRILRFELVNDHTIHYFKPNPGKGTIIVFGKYSGEQIKYCYPNKDHIQNMSFTLRGVWPPVIVFNSDNWNGPPSKYMVSAREKYPHKSKEDLLKRYRIYLINHEFGHALGLGHEPSDTSHCPVMYQHTKGIGHCRSDSNWPSIHNYDVVKRHVHRFLIR